MLRLLDDGSFELEVDGKKTKGLIRAIATADDIIKVASLGCSVVIAEVFLPEAVEEAKKRGVELVDIEDLIEPVIEFLINALANRRSDLLARFFDYLAPPWMIRSYMYWEYPTLENDTIGSIHFKAEFSALKNIKFVAGADVLMMRISSKLVERGIKSSIKTGVDSRGTPSIEFELWYDRRIKSKTDLDKWKSQNLSQKSILDSL